MVSPLRTHEILIGKTAPPLIIGLVHATVYVLAALFVFEVPLRDSLLLLYPSLIVYLAAVIGMLALQILSLVPLVGAIASFLGYGAVLLLAWRTLRSGTAVTPLASQPSPALSAG